MITIATGLVIFTAGAVLGMWAESAQRRHFATHMAREVTENLYRTLRAAGYTRKDTSK